MIDSNSLIEEFVKEVWWTKENSNIPFSIMSLNNKLTEIAYKDYWMTKYTPEIKTAYDDGFFHIHNLGSFSVYCAGWNIEDILLKGFRGQPGRQNSKPAKHFRTALGHIYNFLFTLQGEAAGAEALSNFDTYLAPFIRKDNLTQEEVDQQIQEFIFEMNVPTRVGGQQPFTNITLDQNVPHFMEDNNVILGGKYTDDVYANFQDEMDMLNNAWWKQRIAGDGDGRPQPFPIETLNVTDDFNWDDELLFTAVALRGSPYFSNFIGNRIQKPEDVRSMCCRLRLDLNTLKNKGGGYFGSVPLTGSIGVVTLNMPLLAYKSKDEDKLFELIEKYMEIGKNSLEIKRKILESNIKPTNTLYPFSKFYLEDVYKKFGEYWKNHFNTIGLIGMNEACEILLNKGIESDEGLKLSIKVLEFMRTKALEFQDETNNLYNIEATPGEGTSYRLALQDKKRYPDIITAGTIEAPYYTNSTQLPVNLDKSLTFYLKHQDHLQKLYTGGTVFHTWNGEAVSYWKGVSKMINRMITNTEIPYFTYSPTTSICPVHGFISGKYETCPKCGGETEIWQRITGYFSLVKNWNPGKVQEFKERHPFSVTDDIFV